MDHEAHLPPSLLARIRADPVHAPEFIALAASSRHGPAAKAWRAEQHGSGPKLARRAKRVHARYARVSGAATGVGGLMTMVPDLAMTVWLQSRMVFFIAAAFGFDPLDRMRPAELLVLFELYDTVGEAREALDLTGRTLAQATIARQINGRSDESLTRRLVAMALRNGASRLGGRAVPGFAIIANAVGDERAVRQLGDRAIDFYQR